MPKRCHRQKYRHRHWTRLNQPQWTCQGYWWIIPEEIRDQSIAFTVAYYSRLEALLCIRTMLQKVDPFLLAIHIDHIRLYRYYRKTQRVHARVKATHIQPLTLAEKRFVTGKIPKLA